MELNVFRFFPNLERDERKELVAKLTEASEWNMNFGMLLGCSVLIAALGLLGNAPAVIIGAMLVAPLMTPLIGAGLALVQGNLQLFRTACRTMLLGTAMSLLIGFLVEVLTPTIDIAPELVARGAPNILDLFIAFFAGVAAAYAVARPNLSGALPGVAIAVALVPPLSACAISLGSGHWKVAEGAATLYVTNLVAIVLGSALVFYGHGLQTSRLASAGGHRFLTRAVIGLVCFLLLLAAPLGYRLEAQRRGGVFQPLAHPLPKQAYEALVSRLATEPGIDLILGARAAVDRPVDVALHLAATVPVKQTLIEELQEIVRQKMGKDLVTAVIPLQGAEVIRPAEE
jgi:uncharacterized hydrophobic protein (TIGR00271 family)